MSCGRSCSSCDGCRSAVAGLFDLSAVNEATARAVATHDAYGVVDAAARAAAAASFGPFLHPELRASSRGEDSTRRRMGELLDYVTGATKEAGRAVVRGGEIVAEKAGAAVGAVGDVVTWPVRQVSAAAAKLRTYLVVGAVVVGGFLLLRSSSR